ncbi:hypothetical protein ABZ845_04315 [Streptomyces sp. NPDC047022]|uniref:hypothetical protein n=1 Tax=Streptomyces sp. NPDC047022 TaxID=3155737 RepID=UPI0033D25D11
MFTNRYAGAVVGAVLLGTLGTAACTTSGQAPHPQGQPTRPPATSGAQEGVSDPNPHKPSAKKPPNLRSRGIPVLISEASVSGGAAYDLKGGIKKGGTLAIAVNCQGPGTLQVSVEPTKISFPVYCASGTIEPSLNEIGFTAPRGKATIALSPRGKNVTYSFAVGWDSHPPENR